MGPGRAGGGEEMGGKSGVFHYMQRTAIQGSPPLVTLYHSLLNLDISVGFVSHRYIKGWLRKGQEMHIQTDMDR